MAPTGRRVRILVDFWNLQLAWNSFHEGRGNGRPRLNWRVLPNVLIPRTGDGNGVYHGCHVYASIDPDSEPDERLRRFLHDVMNRFPGFRVIIKDRKRSTHTCPHCRRGTTRTVEKGVDTALVTDLIQAAMDNLVDDAILISNDADFVPAVELIQNRTTTRVIHAGIRSGRQLQNACWSHVVLDEHILDQLIDRQRSAG